MTFETNYKSGKSERDENFPVASRAIAPRFREPILAFYRFARAADDAADHPTLSQDEKFAILAALEDTLLGKSDHAADALPLRSAIAARGLSPQHALDLLVAFRQDVTKRRYQDWNELLMYCRYSAMPVGRFVLDVHSESRATWPASDALCVALQIINHLQDCAKDYRTLDRVYLPLDAMENAGCDAKALSAATASLQLKNCLHTLALKTEALLPDAARLPCRVADLRLSLETAAIVELARKLLGLLRSRDPLSETVHLTKSQALLTACQAASRAFLRRAVSARSTTAPAEDFPS